MLKKKKNRLMLFVLLLFACFACDLSTEIDYKTVGDSNFIVINGFISYEHGVNAIVKKTVPPNQLNTKDYIENPNVWLYKNGKPYKQLIRKDSFEFWLPVDSIQINDKVKYSLRVEADGFKKATTIQQQFVHKSPIDTVFVFRDTINRNTKIHVEFDDDITITNYYSYDIKYFFNGKPDSTGINNFIPLFCLSDEGFDKRIICEIDLSYRDIDSIQVKLYSLSKDFADFYSSYGDYELNYEDYNYETVYTVKSQVENGFGFFASYEFSKYMLKYEYRTKKYE